MSIEQEAYDLQVLQMIEMDLFTLHCDMAEAVDNGWDTDCIQSKMDELEKSLRQAELDFYGDNGVIMDYGPIRHGCEENPRAYETLPF